MLHIFGMRHATPTSGKFVKLRDAMAGFDTASSVNLPHGFLFTDPRISIGQMEDILSGLHHIDCRIGIIFRHYDHPRRGDYAAEYTRMARQFGHMILIAQDIDLAITLEADGFHAPSYMLAQTDFMKFIRTRQKRTHSNWMMSGACHNMDELTYLKDVMDVGFLSPIFATNSHPDAKSIDIIQAQDWMNTVNAKGRLLPPIYALGGVTLDHLPHIIQANFNGFGAIDLFQQLCESPD